MTSHGMIAKVIKYGVQNTHLSATQSTRAELKVCIISLHSVFWDACEEVAVAAIQEEIVCRGCLQEAKCNRTLVGHYWEGLGILDDCISRLSNSRKYLRYTNFEDLTNKIRRYWNQSSLCVYWVLPSDEELTYCRIFPNSTGPTREDVVGAVSCIVWSLTLIPLIKYCWIVLRAGDDQGEGKSVFFRINSWWHFRLVYAFEPISESR